MPDAALSELADTFAGGTPARSNPAFFGGEIPWVKSGEVKGSVNQTEEFLTGLGLASSSAKWIPAGSTLVAMYGANAGDVARLNISATANQAVLAVVARSGTDSDYLYQAISWVSQKLLRKAQGSGQPNLNAEIIRAEKIARCDLEDQKRIAAVLDTWDNAIAIAERLIAAKRERFGWMLDMVLTGSIRLSGFDGDWRRVRLAQVLHEHRATSTGAEPVYSVSVHRGLVDQVEHLGRSFAAASTSNYNRVKPGDIVYTKSPTGDFPLGIIKQSKIDRTVIVSPLYGVFKPETRELGIVLDAYFSSAPNALRYLTPLVQKGAKNTIAVTNTQFLQGEVRLPIESREVDALSALIGMTLEDIAVSEGEAALLRRQKRGLMQKLLTGEWRVPATGDAFAPRGPVADRLEAAE